MSVNFRFPILALGVACRLGALAQEAGADPEPAFSREHPRKITFQTDWFPQGEHGGFYQALAKGFYAEAGLDVTLLPGGPGAGITLKVARGDADLGMHRSDSIIVATVEQGLPLLMVGAVTQHDYESLMVHDESPVRTFADLNGRTLIGSPGQIWMQFLQKKLGLQFNLIPATGALGVFLADPEAIQQCVYTNEPFLARQHGAKVRVLPLATAGYDVYTVLFCRRDFAQRNPAATRAFIAASLRGWHDFLEGDPAPAFAEILRRNPNVSPELLAFSREEMIRHQVTTGDPQRGEAMGQLSRTRLRDQIATLVDLKILAVPVAPGQVASWDYLPPEAK
jgi:NitT/TauT family transport system substrate-binding protein